MRMFRSREGGFTLIELLVVISIIGLLASVVLAAVNSARIKGAIGAGEQADANVYHYAGAYLAGEWDFNECSGTKTADISGNGHDATVYSTIWSTNTPFKSGCSLQWGNVAWPPLPISSNMGGFTISIWVYETNNSTAYQYPISGTGGPLGEYEIETNGGCGTGGCIRFIPVHNVFLDTGNVLPLSQWTNIIAVYNPSGGAAGIYVNGAAVPFTNNGTGSLSQPTDVITGLVLNKRAGTGYHPFVGNIDEVRVYTTAFTAEAAERLYAEGAPEHGLALR